MRLVLHFFNLTFRVNQLECYVLFVRRRIVYYLTSYLEIDINKQIYRLTLIISSSMLKSDLPWELFIFSRPNNDSETHTFLNSSDDISMGCCICKHSTCNLAVYREITGAPVESLIFYSFENTVSSFSSLCSFTCHPPLLKKRFYLSIVWFLKIRSLGKS